MRIAGGKGYIQIGDGESIPCTFEPFELTQDKPIICKPALPLVNSQTAEQLKVIGWVEDRDYLLTPDLPMED